MGERAGVGDASQGKRSRMGHDLLKEAPVCEFFLLPQVLLELAQHVAAVDV